MSGQRPLSRSPILNAMVLSLLHVRIVEAHYLNSGMSGILVLAMIGTRYNSGERQRIEQYNG